MKTVAVFLAVCFLASGCDSKNPLCDPKTSKADERLIGVWQGRSNDASEVYHFRRAGHKFPDSVMRVAYKSQSLKDESSISGELLAFPTVLAGKTYLNVSLFRAPKQDTLVNETGWKPGPEHNYAFVRYQVDGDKLATCPINDEAKGQAIKDGKIKGVIGPDNAATFTDTTENIARFVREAGDNLFAKEPFQLTRMVGGKKP